jgi:cell wall-associated NlpC family hydrolase
MGHGARRSLLTLGTWLALLTAVAAASAPAALAAPLTRVRPAAGFDPAGLADLPDLGVSAPARAVTVASMSRHAKAPALAPLHGLLQPDVLVVAAATLPARVAAAVRRMPGVVAAESLDAARIRVNGAFTAMLGVDPSAFRPFAAKLTAASLGLWQNVAAGGVAVSLTMGKLDQLPLGLPLRVAGRRTEELPVAGFGTVGIGGVDAVVSDATARSLGIPAGNAILISAPHAELSSLIKQIGNVLPRGAAIAPLVAQREPAAVAPAVGAAAARPAILGAAGATGVGAADGAGLSRAQVVAFVTAAESRLGLPYVWGGKGPGSFDCSGLVEWSLAQAGVAMPRVAADQARSGPQIPLRQLEAGDLLFYHTDPTAPGYISHVAIYIGGGQMIQAPQPGQLVQVVPADFGPEFAGAVAVYPKVAAAVAGSLAG